MIDKNKFLDYIVNNFTIDKTAYDLIGELYEIYKYKTNKLLETLNNCNIDITLEEIEKNNLYDEETIFYNKQYDKMATWINKASNEELKEHYEWYKVCEGDKEDLLNTMYESYCDTFTREELEERCDNLLKED